MAVHPADAHASERLPAFIHEHIGCLRLLLTLQALEPGELITLEIVDAVGAAFQPADLNGALGKIDVIPSQVTGFRHPEAVPIDQQGDQPVPVTVPVRLQRSEQLGHLGFGKVFPRSVGLV